jgi:hypothetical protein
MKSLTLTLLLLVCSLAVSAQQLQGKVIDAQTKQTLAFVNISVEGTTLGTSTDINGRFSLLVMGDKSVRISYVGYKPQVITAAEYAKQSYWVIALEESVTELEGVIIWPGENPAHKIIRKATANRHINNPENLNSFTYRSYNKLYATFDDTAVPDTTTTLKFLKNSHLFVSESVSERKYIRPRLNKETVVGNRMTGVKDPFFAILASDFQPFTFYEDYIPLLDKKFRNPISPGSIGRYDYLIADTLYRGSDTTYIIQFEPLPGKTFEALRGQLYINTHGYAIENAIAQPSDPQSLVSIIIQQQYTFVYGHWFPKQLNTTFSLKEYKVGNRSLVYKHSSYITEPEIDVAIPKKEFGLLSTEFAPAANQQGDSFWMQERIDSLSLKESNTFKLYDSLSTQLAFMNTSMKLLEGLSVGKFKMGKFYLPLEHLLRVNQYEGLRLGIGLQTSEAISKVFQLEAHGAYGFKDKALKYGGGLQINVWKRKDLYLKFSYKQDVVEPANTHFIKTPIAISGAQALRNWMAARMDSVEQFNIALNIRPIRFTQLMLFAKRDQYNPAYAYNFSSENQAEPSNRFTIAEVGMQLRIVPREKYTQIGNFAVVTTVSYPQINISVSKGMDGVVDGQYAFTKATASLDHTFMLRGFGQTTFQLSGGWLDGHAPYPVLFNGKGANFSSSLFNNVMVASHFQTMGLYEFLSDRYAYLFLTHNFGRLTSTKSKIFRPELSIIHNMGIGSLENPEAHQLITFSTLEKGFFESGLTLTNLVRFNYLNLFYFGIGGGGFYRYGPYAFDRESKNLSAKLLLTVTL